MHLSGIKTARRDVAIGPQVCGLSRKGGECGGGAGGDWHEARIREFDPSIAKFQARLLCAGSILMSGGHVTGLRPARLSKPGGYTYTLYPGRDPGSRWQRTGKVAGPFGRLP